MLSGSAVILLLFPSPVPRVHLRPPSSVLCHFSEGEKRGCSYGGIFLLDSPPPAQLKGFSLDEALGMWLYGH